MTKPLKTLGLRHIALNVFNVNICAQFYIDIFSMKIDWQPDSFNIYLTSGCDNLALHQVDACEMDAKTQRLDHIGFFVESPEAVDNWCAFLKEKNVAVLMEPKTHRDGSRSLYCKDPEGTVVQIIYVKYLR